MSKQFKTGDRGQRYEHHVLSGGNNLIIGWSDSREAFKVMVKLNPSWSNHRVIDRQKGSR